MPKMFIFHRLAALGKRRNEYYGKYYCIVVCQDWGWGIVAKSVFASGNRFLGRIFLILRRNFPNMEEDFPNIKEEFSKYGGGFS